MLVLGWAPRRRGSDVRTQRTLPILVLLAFVVWCPPRDVAWLVALTELVRALTELVEGVTELVEALA